jgi:signal transduction histidine kinase
MKLFQIWTNLVKNAIDAFEDSEIDQKYIKISSESDDQSIKIHIENNGPQIPEENVKRIFKKFFTTKQNINGTGLGLSIVSNIVEEHYGKISLTSDEKKTTFTITFPKLENTKAEQ